MHFRKSWFTFLAASLIGSQPCFGQGARDVAISPRDTIIRPFNGNDLSGFTTWLQETKHEDPQSDYRVTDGMIHIGGRGMGYLATENDYQNYHLSVEFKWGHRTDGSKYVRNSGILLHATGRTMRVRDQSGGHPGWDEPIPGIGDRRQHETICFLSSHVVRADDFHAGDKLRVSLEWRGLKPESA